MTTSESALDAAGDAATDRLVAYLVDFLLLSVVAAVIWAVVLVIQLLTGISATPGTGLVTTDLGVIALLGAMWLVIGAVLLGYFAVLDARGGTLGKRLRGLDVVTTGGEPAGLGDTVVRTVVLLAPLPLMAALHVFLTPPGLGFGLGLVVMAGWLLVEAALIVGSDSHRRLGDRLAGTVVVESS